MNPFNFGWATTVITFVVFTSIVASCTAHTEHKRQESVQALAAKGIDPLDIPCAVNAGTERYCELRAATKKQEGK